MWTEFSSSLLKERYFYAKHKSGLPVYVFPKKMTGTYALLSAKYGSLDDAFSIDGQAPVCVPDGVAHFLEHKLFENEDGSDSFRRFSALGADANAYTTYNRTAYLFNCTEHFEECLEELLRFVFSPYFTDATVKKEQGIIAEEIRMYEDHPWDRCDRNMLRVMYQKHPVRKNIAGTVSSIMKITPKLLYDCHHVFYHPSNMALIVCGNVDRDAVLDVVERMLPQKSEEPVFQRILPDEPKSVLKHDVRERMAVAKPLFCLGFKDHDIPRDAVGRAKRDAAMTLLGEILFSRSEYLYNDLFESGCITPSFGFGYSSSESFGLQCVSGEADSPEAVRDRIFEYLDTVRKEGLSKDAFERCQRALYSDEIRTYDSIEEIADRLLSAVFDGVELFSYPELLQSVTYEELTRLLETVLRPENAVLSVIEPIQP